MYQPTFFRSLWWKYLSLPLPWRKKILVGRDLEGNLFFSLGKLQSSGRERRMVKYRERKDWASYTLTRILFLGRVNEAQWQSWLRHGRLDPPSLQELLEDIARRENTRRLAKIADERWKSLETKKGERLALKDSDDALRAVQGKQEREEDALTGKRELPGQDPGAAYQPQSWSGKISTRK